MPSGNAVVRVRFSGVIEDELTGKAEPGWFRITSESDGMATLEVRARGQNALNRQVEAPVGFLQTIFDICFGRS